MANITDGSDGSEKDTDDPLPMAWNHFYEGFCARNKVSCERFSSPESMLIMGCVMIGTALVLAILLVLHIKNKPEGRFKYSNSDIPVIIKFLFMLGFYFLFFEMFRYYEDNNVLEYSDDNDGEKIAELVCVVTAIFMIASVLVCVWS